MRSAGWLVLAALLAGIGLGAQSFVPAAPTQVIIRVPPPAATVTIQVPTGAPTYDAGSASAIAISGIATSLASITGCTWTNSLGGAGAATGTPNYVWAITSVPLAFGSNVITVFCTDVFLQAGTAVITITRTLPPIPIVTITTPTSSPTFDAGTASTQTVAGAASTSATISGCSWTNSLGGSGTAAGTTTWTIANLPLTVGVNNVTVTCADPFSQTGTAMIAITRSAGGPVTNLIAASRVPSNSQTLPDSAWAAAGVTGGIPSASWTQCGSTITAGASVATIQAAINACTANHYVLLGAGAFPGLSTNLAFSAKTNVALRGQGANSTFLTFSNAGSCTGTGCLIFAGSADVHYWGSGGQSNSATWSAGYARGTTTITLSTAANLLVGAPLELDQLADTSDGGQIYICNDGNCSSGSAGFERNGRPQGQVVTVVSCSPACPNGGSTAVTISPGLYMPNWRSGQTPQAFWPTSPSYGIGIENLSVDGTATSTSAAGIFFFNCQGCWVKGVRSVFNGGGTGRAHFMAWGSPHCEVRDSYFFGQNNWNLITAYGLEMNFTSDCKVENNIFQQVQAPIVMNSPNEGNVFAYNYALNERVSDHPTFFNHTIFCHAVQSFVLMEGNIGAGFYCDNSHGSHHFITNFRNRWLGYDINGTTAATGNSIPERIDVFSRFYNIVCNVLGDDRRPHTVYEANNDQAIYRIGQTDYTIPNPLDVRTNQSLLRWGNYDSVNNATRWLASEVPTAETTYPNSVPGSQTCPNSMYLAAKPSWWGSVLPWPGVGPDITGGPSTQGGTGADGHAYNNPASACYFNTMGGPANGSGPPLTFSAAACYP